MMNREQRRAYASKIRGDKRASKCPLCGYTSLFYSAPELKPYEGVKEKFTAEDFNVVKHNGSDLVLIANYNLNVGSKKKNNEPAATFGTYKKVPLNDWPSSAPGISPP